MGQWLLASRSQRIALIDRRSVSFTVKYPGKCFPQRQHKESVVQMAQD